MEQWQLRLLSFIDKLKGPEALQTWRTTPQKGVQYKIIIILTIVALITETVFQTMFIGIFKIRKQDEVDYSTENYTLVYTYTVFSFLIGTMIGNIISGILADKLGRRNILLISLMISIPYCWLYVVILWIVYALNFSIFSGFFIISFAFLLGLLNNQLSVLLASGFDISSHLAQVFSVVFIFFIGCSFGPAILKEVLGVGYIISINHQWFFPIMGFVLSGVLCIALAITFQFIPETLGKEIPPHPLEEIYCSVISSGSSERDSVISPSHGDEIAHHIPLSDDLDQGWTYPLHVLRDIRSWILFWVTFGFYGAVTSLTIISVIANITYGESVSSNAFGIVFISERIIVALVSIILLIIASIHFPHRVLQVGYLLLFKASVIFVFIISILATAFTFVLAFVTSAWFNTISLIIYPIALDIVLFSTIIFTVSLYCMTSNVGFRNESGFLFGFISAAIIGGIVSVVPILVSMNDWFIGMNFGRFPLILVFIVFILGLTTGLVFYRLDNELNIPRYEQRKHSDKSIDRPIYLGSPVLFSLIIVLISLFYLIYNLI